jgi:hypothetical protein
MPRPRKSRWTGRYTVKSNFIRRMEPLIERQVEIYAKDPKEFARQLPIRLHLFQTQKAPSQLIHAAITYAECLIATGRIPTAEYMWHLMAIDPSDAPAYIEPNGQKLNWQPHLSPGLLTLKQYRKRQDEKIPF